MNDFPAVPFKIVMRTMFVVIAVAASLLAALFVFTQWQSARIAAQYPPQGLFVDVDGARVHYTDLPAKGVATGGQIATVLLIHGASGNEADMRLPLGERLAAKGFRVVSVDRPGQGWSARLDDGDASPARQAQRIRAAVEKIGIHEVIVVGHSLAGVLTLQLALDHADFARGVMVMSGVTHPWPGGIAAYYRLTAMPIVGPLIVNTIIMPIGLATLDKAIASVFDPQPTPQNYLERVGVPLVLRPGAFRANSQDVDVIKEFVTREAPRYPSIRVPVAVLTGDRDAIVFTHIHSDGTARDVPGATMQVLPGVGHSPHWADPDAVVDAIVGLAGRVAAR